MKWWIGYAVLMLALLAGCAVKTPEKPVQDNGAEEAVQTVNVLEFAPREAYHLTEIEVQSVEDGAVLTVDGVCELNVKGFGCGKTITADGKTCAGAKTGETLVWLTCDYTNLTESEVSPGRLLESGMLRHDSGSAEGKSASFAKLLPGEMAEVYFYYAIPESLTEQPLTLQFTIGGQTYSYEIPADKSAALAPTAPEEAEPDEEPEDTEQITLQEPPKQEEIHNETVESITEDTQKEEYYFKLEGGCQEWVQIHGFGVTMPPNETEAYYTISTNRKSVYLSMNFDAPSNFDARDGVWNWNADIPEYLNVIPSEDNMTLTLEMSGETHCEFTFTYYTPEGIKMSYYMHGYVWKKE